MVIFWLPALITVVAGPDGKWTVPNPGDLTDGQTVTATATDPAGNPSLPGTGVVDAVAPTVAVTTALTNDSTPALTITWAMRSQHWIKAGPYKAMVPMPLQ
nr:hypothetical protein [Acinetobacter nosocomialis]